MVSGPQLIASAPQASSARQAVAVAPTARARPALWKRGADLVGEAAVMCRIFATVPICM
ncbi:hypothetical protein SALBM311S_08273 [Streptomyces alboniger]